MDRLSLDHTYREQQEWLRQRPLGVADGVRSGLTGFGLSLLGRLLSHKLHSDSNHLGAYNHSVSVTLFGVTFISCHRRRTFSLKCKLQFH